MWPRPGVLPQSDDWTPPPLPHSGAARRIVRYPRQRQRLYRLPPLTQRRESPHPSQSLPVSLRSAATSPESRHYVVPDGRKSSSQSPRPFRRAFSQAYLLLDRIASLQRCNAPASRRYAMQSRRGCQERVPQQRTLIAAHTATLVRAVHQLPDTSAIPLPALDALKCRFQSRSTIPERDTPASDDAEKLTMGPVVMLYAAQFSCYSW